MEGGEVETVVEGADPAPGSDGEATSPEQERIAALEAEVASFKDRYLRAVAEMENVRRRARLDVEEAHRFANTTILTDLLPVLDNFQRALQSPEQDFEALRSGVELIYGQFQDTLQRAGLVAIPAQGEAFDPNLHEAILQVPCEEGQQPMTIVEELRPGYRLTDRVLRPSLVKVAAG
ncbi:MAG: nucleotide exchange factor GrpE [Armatimonadetes bacterium]|nr:nucleotide exchange factor GrpE [Armatimonadota bacterium]